LKIHRAVASNVTLYFTKLLADANEPAQLTPGHECSAGFVQRFYEFDVAVIIQIKTAWKHLSMRIATLKALPILK
jgi:hypothetical protein